MSNYLKYFRSEFEKYAQGLEGPGAPPVRPSRPSAGGGGAAAPARGGPSRGGPPARPSAGVPTHGGGAVNPVADIKKMQQAMQNFAAAVTKYSFNKPQKPGDKPTVNDSKKPFNDFITEAYMADSPIKGEEYSTDPTRQTQQQKQPTNLIEMNTVIDGLKRIGSRGSELRADNMWDFRTNNALKNIYAFAYSLVNLSKDFGRTNVQSFDDGDLSKMAELIPKEENPKDIPAAEKSTKAKALIPLINKLTTFYNYYVDQIANHPAYVRYIIGEEPLMNIKPGGDPLEYKDDEKELLSRVNDLSVNFGQGPIPLSALQSEEALVDYLATSMRVSRNQLNNPKFLLGMLQNMVKMIDGKLAQSPATPQPQQQAKPKPTQQVDAGTPQGTGPVRSA